MKKLALLICLAFWTVHAQGNVISCTVRELPQDTLVNLTQEGTLDWAHWGGYGMNHKLVNGQQVGLISDFSQYDVGTLYSYNDGDVLFSWTDGFRTASVDGTRHGVYLYGNSQGFTINVPAGMAELEMTLYVAVSESGGRVEAKWDQPLYYDSGIEPDFTSAVVSSAIGRKHFAYDLVFQSDTQSTLYVTFVEFHRLGQYDYTSLQAVTLKTPEPASLSLLLAGGAILLRRRNKKV